MGDYSDWDLYLPAVQLGLNARISSRHKSAPFALMFGRALNGFKDYSGTQSLPLSEPDLLSRAEVLTRTVYPAIASVVDSYNASMSHSHTSRHKIIQPLSVGDLVMRFDVEKSRKRSPSYAGPYTISAIHKNGSYSLMDRTGALFHSKITTQHLKPIHHPIDFDTNSLEVKSWITVALVPIVNISFHGKVWRVQRTVGSLSPTLMM